MKVLNFPVLTVGDVHGAEMTVKRIPRFNLGCYFLANEIIYARFGNAFDGCVMAAGKRRRIIIEPDKLGQIIVRIFGVVETPGHDHSGRIPAKKSSASAEDDDTEDVSAKLGTGDGGTICKNLTASYHAQVGGGLERIILIAEGGVIIIVNEGIEGFSGLHFHEIFAFRKVDFGSGFRDRLTVVNNARRNIVANRFFGNVSFNKTAVFFCVISEEQCRTVNLCTTQNDPEK